MMHTGTGIWCYGDTGSILIDYYRCQCSHVQAPGYKASLNQLCQDYDSKSAACVFQRVLRTVFTNFNITLIE